MSVVYYNKKLLVPAFKACRTNALQRLMMRHVLGVGVGDGDGTINVNESQPINVNSSKPQLRFVQFLRQSDRNKRLGVVSDDGTTLVELSGGSCISNDFISFLQQNISPYEICHKIQNLRREPMHDRLILLPPITNPNKIICVALNYHDHISEQKKQPPEEPIFFSKFNNTLIGPRGNIIAHKLTNKMDWEIELAVVIGTKCHNVSPNEAMDYVFGYTIAQDISARDLQKRNGGQFLLGKSMDTFCPLGPVVVHKSIIPNPHNLYLKCAVNGVIKQNGNTSQMIFKIPDLISRLSRYMTLVPGDVILTGTPGGVGMYRNPPEYLKCGDMITSEIQCLGKLRNIIVAPKK